MRNLIRQKIIDAQAQLVPEFTRRDVRVPQVAGKVIAVIGPRRGGKTTFLWIVDVTDEKHPTQFASYQIDDIPGEEQPYMTGCHQPVEKITSTEIPVAWFAHGMRVVDIARPHAPKEIAYYLPDVPPGSERVQSNDVFVDGRGLIYLLDRVRGLNILERT